MGCQAIPGWSALGTGGALGDHPGENLARGTWHTRRLPEVRTRWTRGALGGFWEVPMCLGTRGHVALSGSIRDSPGVSLGTRGLLGGLPEEVYGSGTRRHVSLSENFRRVCCLGFGTRDRWRARASSGRVLPAWGIRGHVACSEGRTERSLGAASKGLRGSFRLDLWDTWHSSKESAKGFSKRASKGLSAGLRFGSERCLGRASGTRVIFREGSEGVFRAGRFERVSEGGSSGRTFIVGLEING